jgi:hypothetical protein
MIAQIPILAVSSSGEIFDRCRFFRTKCIYMHLEYLNLTRIKSSNVLNILPDHLASTMRMCASVAHSSGSAFKASFYAKVHRLSCFSLNWPPDPVLGHVLNVPTIVSGLHSAVLSSTSDPPDLILSTLNKYKLRNRSLLPKSRERSIRQGGRMGDKYRRYKTCH